MTESSLFLRQAAAEHIARQAGSMLLEKERQKHLLISEKHDNDYVTEADTASEAMIIVYLSGLFPGEGFHGEEGGDQGSAFPRWIIDPIDGTMNYMRSLPNYTISIGWEEEPGKPLIGIVYNVRQDEMFSGCVGYGATCNHRPIHVSDIADPRKALLVCETPHRKKEWASSYWKLFGSLFNQCSDIRTFGSIALELCYIASGRLEAVFEYSLGYWDIAAGTAILRAAGGLMEPIEQDRLLSEEPCDIIASNALLHSWIADQVRAFGTIRS